MIGMTKKEADLAWSDHQDVICPLCENHVHEEEASVYNGEVCHSICENEDRRFQQACYDEENRC